MMKKLSEGPCRLCGGSVWKDTRRKLADGSYELRKKCLICCQYTGARLNASKPRTYERQPQFLIDRREFAAWAQLSPLVCYSCGIPQHLLESIGLKTQANLPLRWLGLDRLAGGDYTLENVAWCCYGCNSARSNRYSVEEMRGLIGPTLARVWRQRLRAAGVSDPWIGVDHV